MIKRKRTKGQTTIYKTLHRKQNKNRVTRTFKSASKTTCIKDNHSD